MQGASRVHFVRTSRNANATLAPVGVNKSVSNASVDYLLGPGVIIDCRSPESCFQVCAVHKPGGSCASGEQLNTCLQLCQQHAERLLPILTSAVDVHAASVTAVTT